MTSNLGAITPQSTIKIKELRKNPGIAVKILKKPNLILLTKTTNNQRSDPFSKNNYIDWTFYFDHPKEELSAG